MSSRPTHSNKARQHFDPRPVHATGHRVKTHKDVRERRSLMDPHFQRDINSPIVYLTSLTCSESNRHSLPISRQLRVRTNAPDRGSFPRLHLLTQSTALELLYSCILTEFRAYSGVVSDRTRNTHIPITISNNIDRQMDATAHSFPKLSPHFGAEVIPPPYAYFSPGPQKPTPL